MLKIVTTMTKDTYQKKPGTKTVWELVESFTSQVDNCAPENVADSCGFFRRGGNSETVSREYTCAGYMPVSVTSINKEKTSKIVRKFDYNSKEV